ncbi:hypothetical protein [Nocardioides sp. B-3]|uniref:hypothetical protein n=1 Tax=Nocardioides sp. B-3 TaxID=2895565 RepID=UPI0021523B2A|nr:hypothetical protein [Nocardioides sp. B-3]UUZ59107.1 hypothetical protein LP418_24690 [Nocardioides sp. B-3]
MSRSTRTRLVAASGVLALTALSLTACGSDDGSGTDAAGGLDSVKITGDIGKAPKVTREGEVDPEEIETEVLTEGDGDVIEAGDGALAHIWIGNGFTEEEAYNSYETKAPQLLIGEISKPFRGGPGGPQGRLPGRRGGQRHRRLRRGRQLPARHRQQGRPRLRGRPDGPRRRRADR